MNNKKPKDPLYPKGFEKRDLNELLPKPKPKDDDELTLLKKFNHKLGVYLNPSDTNITENEKKKDRYNNNNTDIIDPNNLFILFFNL